MISYGELLRTVNYDENTGIFTRKKSQGLRRISGIQLGSVTAAGYVKITIKGKQYQAHRLAWLYVYGKWPDNSIDHINGVRHDNRIANLRDVTDRVNSENQRKAHKRNKTELLGVTINPKSLKFRAMIQVKGDLISLGSFKSKRYAHQVYVEAKRQMHEGCTI